MMDLRGLRTGRRGFRQYNSVVAGAASHDDMLQEGNFA